MVCICLRFEHNDEIQWRWIGILYSLIEFSTIQQAVFYEWRVGVSVLGANNLPRSSLAREHTQHNPENDESVHFAHSHRADLNDRVFAKGPCVQAFKDQKVDLKIHTHIYCGCPNEEVGGIESWRREREVSPVLISTLRLCD
jgi:hypothetical protein